MNGRTMWKPVPGYEGLYEVSNSGRVRSLARTTTKGKILHLNVDPPPSLPYHYVILSKGGKTKRFRVHTLVLTTFAGPCPGGLECRHLNGNPSDNRWPENLAWGTSAENKADMVAHGGTMVRHFKINKSIADKIRALNAIGSLTQKEIGRRFGVSQPTVNLICKNRAWL